MINGSCLCGAVTFEIRQAQPAMEICHCNRCRKQSGAASMTTVTVLADDYKLLTGKELISSYAAPIIYSKPAYQSFFCSNCGSPVPPIETTDEYMEIPAGLLDNDPAVKPDKHIFVEFLPPWDKITDDLPQLTMRELVKSRHNRELPEDFQIKSHYDAPATK